MASCGVLELLAVATIVVCLSQPTSGGNSRKPPKPIEYERRCPIPGSGDDNWEEADENGKRCCYENNYINNRITSSYKYCYTEPGCCGEHGKLYCCYMDKLTVYLVVGITLGALALLAAIFGGIFCCLRRSGFTMADCQFRA